MISINKLRTKKQREAYRAIVRELLSETRAQIIFPPGGGKTYIATMLIDDSARSMMLVPSTQLIEQSIVEYRLRGKGRRAIGSICSVKPPRGVDWLRSVGDIEEFILKEEFLLVCTYQSQHKLIEAFFERRKADLIICDESHRTAGRGDKPWGRILSSNISEKIVFMTATAKIYNSVIKSNTDINCQLDETVYGRNVYTLSIKEARELGFIQDFRVCVLVDNENLIGRKALSKGVVPGVAKKHNNRIPTDYEIALVANSIREAYRQGYRKVLAYTNTRRDTMFFADLLIALQDYAGLPNLIHDAGGDPNANVFISLQEHRAVRGSIIERFSKRRGLSILFSCQTLAEGVNIPIADCASLLAPRDSPINITQLVGRLLRLHPSKKKASLLIVPAIVQDMAEFECKSTFQALRSVLFALRNFDDSWQIEIDALADIVNTDTGTIVTDRLQLTTPPGRLTDITVRIGAADWETLSSGELAEGIRDTAKGVAVKHGIQI